jgi:hypothetical protein
MKERSKAPTAVSAKITVFWDVISCSLVRSLLTPVCRLCV